MHNQRHHEYAIHDDVDYEVVLLHDLKQKRFADKKVSEHIRQERKSGRMKSIS